MSFPCGGNFKQTFQEKQILGSDAENSVVGLIYLPIAPFCSSNLTTPNRKPASNTTKKRMEMLRGDAAIPS